MKAIRPGRLLTTPVRWRVLPLLVVSLLIHLIQVAPCLAQTATTAPAVNATAPPTTALPATAVPATAVPGVYEHDSLHHVVGASASGGGKSTTTSQTDYSSTFDIRRVVTALAIVLSLVFACRWGARWMFPTAAAGRSSQIIKVLSRSVIAPRQQLLLIQVGRRLVLVGDCGQQMNALAEISDPDEVAGLIGQLRSDPPAVEDANPFSPLLGRARREFENLTVPPAADPDEADAELAMAGVDQTRGELSGLTDKIRMLSQLGKM